MDEEQIITLFFARSEQAIEALDAKYGKLFHSLSYHIVNDRQDADECVNDAYLGAWNAIPPAKPDSLLPYMARIVRNISLKCYWKKGAAKRNSPYTLALQEVEECLPDRKSAEEEVEAYSVFISDGYPTMGQVDYADGSQFRIQYGSGDISGIYGGTLEESREIAGVSVAYYQYDSMSYAIWEANGFACSYLYTNGGDAEVDLLIQQGP